MDKSRLALLCGALLSLTAVLALSATGAATRMLVPPVGMQLDPNWKPQTVKEQPFKTSWSNVRVNTDKGVEAQNEPYVAVDPRNAAHLIVGANNWEQGAGMIRVTTYASFDSGKTWVAATPPAAAAPQLGNAADPALAFDAAGAAYLAYTSYAGNKSVISLSRSTDGGKSWAAPTIVSGPSGEADKPALVAANGKLYLFWVDVQQGLLGRAISDSGKTLGDIVVLSRQGGFPAIAIGAGGTINVFYVTQNGTHLLMARLIDSGKGALQLRTTTVSNVVALQARPTHYRATIVPSAGADARGNLFVTWADGRNTGKGNDILLSSSRDGGLTWAAPTLVNDDSGAADQLFPALAVDAAGTLNIVWLDNRNDPHNYNYNIYLARLTSGSTHATNSRLTNVSSNPDNDPRIQGQMIGDFFAIATAGGKIYPLWTDTRNNNQDIFLAPIDLSGK